MSTGMSFFRAHALKHFGAARHRDAEIEDAQIVHARAELFESRFAVPHPIDGIAFVAQGFLYAATDQAIIFYEQQAHDGWLPG